MTSSKKICLTVCVALAGMFAVGIWSEATDISLFGLASFEPSPAVSEKKDGAVVKRFEHEMTVARRSLSALTFYAAGITVVSCMAILILWIPLGVTKSGEPKQRSAQTPASITPTAGAPVAPTSGTAQL